MKKSIKVVLSSLDASGKAFTYSTSQVIYKDDFIEFVDIKNNKMIVPISRIIEIVEQGDFIDR